MKEYHLKYGTNPNQIPARIYMEQGELPLEILNGRPGYINFLDALNGWQLVKELREATALAAAASFKHVSPAGAAVGVPLTDNLRLAYQIPPEEELSELAAAYARARGADRLCSFGDWIALSDICDLPTARLISREVSDGIIAPGYEEEALNLLKTKRGGNYAIVRIDPAYKPKPIEHRHVFGITFEQERNQAHIDYSRLQNIVTGQKQFKPTSKRDLLIALLTLKYTQSNSVCYVQGGQTIGVGAGQQSRIHCTRLAGDKADIWQLRQHPAVLALDFPADAPRPLRDNAIDEFIRHMDGKEKRDFLSQIRDVALASDAFFPFADNIERAAQSGVSCIAQPGGSIRDEEIIAACNELGIVMAFTGLRLFHH